ncbi:MAG TPA: 23S rRNA (guanosine(2251)-2'-O)-methyltransferase RlmB [Pyrinomonadaceae bacterium]|nr:23S rRNA (guanosine(2251)-2'-O)-methyltransferase RlmB [Pyrinomonadaceae bacterium]
MHKRSKNSNHDSADPKRDWQRNSSSTPEPVNVIYGVNPVLEALRAGKRSIESITIVDGARTERLKELFQLAKDNRIPIHRVNRVVFDQKLGDARHQGVMAQVAAARYTQADDLLDDLSGRINSIDPPLVVVLDGLEDPRNVGSILRTAECSGVHGVFIPERRAVGLTEVVAKAAAGALEYVPVARVTNLVRLIEQLKERNIWVVGASGDAQQSYTEWNWSIPTALILGNEGNGLHRLVSESCDALVSIPVSGRLQSLNVSVAAGVLLYEARRQRLAAEKTKGAK